MASITQLSLGTDGTVTATIVIPSDAKAGDTLTYSVNGGTPVEVTLTDTNIASGIAVEVAPEATITATITDAAGNTSLPGTATALSADTSVNAPTITIAGDANHDGVYNAAELGTDGTVTATIVIPSDAKAGDTLTYSVNGGTPVEVTLTDTNIASGIAVEVAPEATITATITDAAGNTSLPGTATALSADTSVNAPTITIAGDANDDGVYNAAELGTDGTVTATIAIPSDAKAGDTLTYSVNGGTPVEVTLTTANIASGIAVEVAPLATITATITDTAGNTSSEATATALAADTSVNAPTITIAGDANDDGVYNAAELGTDGTVTATIVIPSDAKAGDTLTYSVNGGTPVEVTLTTANIASGIAVEVAPLATITATITDTAGNTSSEATATALAADTSVNAPTITIAGDANDDGVYNAAELGTDGTVTATIAIPSDAKAGDTLTYSVNGGTPVEVTLTTANIASGIAVEVAPLATITATITDTAGNTSSEATATALAADTSVNAPTITIAGDANDDGVYNAAELGTDGTVTATIAIPSDAKAGDTLTYSVNGGTPVEVTLTTANIASGIAVEVAPLATITATITDTAGNTSLPGTATALSADTSVNAPTITIAGDANHDGVFGYNESENNPIKLNEASVSSRGA